MQITNATHDDISDIAQLHAASMAELIELAHGLGFEAPEALEPAAAEEMYQERFDDEDALLLVASEAGRLLGFVSAAIANYEDDLLPSPYMTIEFIIVAADARRLGVAQQLLEAIELRGKELGIQVADLLVWENNRGAIMLYERNGYTTIERRMAKRLV